MKRLLLMLPLLLALGCSAVGGVPSRSEVVGRLPEIREVERKMGQAQYAIGYVQMMGVEFSKDEEKALKEHMDLLYMYINALNSAAVNGDPSYDSMLLSANREVKALMDVLTIIIEKPQTPVGTSL